MKSIVIIAILCSLQSLVRTESNCDDNAKLQYEAGKSYVYNIELVSYDSTQEDYVRLGNRRNPLRFFESRTRGKITTSGKVVLTALENCKFALTLQSVEIDVAGERIGEVVDSKNGSVPRTSMLFTFRNGEVTDLYKQKSGGTVWTENIIRGILTMIQNKGMGNSDGEPEEKETTIKGECISKIYIPQEGVFTKTIHPYQCSEPVVSHAEGVPYEHSSYPMRAPNLRHSHSYIKCIQTISNGFLSTVSCTEMMRHRMAGFGHETTSTITLDEGSVETEQAGGASTSEISALSAATSIHYDAMQTSADETWGDDILSEVLSIAQTMYQDKEENSAELYLKLKEKMAFLKYPHYPKLEKMITQATNGDSLQNQFVLNMVRDVATEIGTGGAVHYIAKLIHQQEIKDEATAGFYTHLHLTQDATLEGLKALGVIIQDTLDEFNNGGIMDAINVFSEGKKNIRQQLLGVSGYAYHFCRRVPNCGELQEYQTLIDNIAKFAVSKLPSIAPAALQALGNVPSLPEEATKIIGSILIEKGSLLNGGMTKLFAAFDAFRREPCSPTLKKMSRIILSDDETAFETRMAAYMAIVRCVTEDDVSVINEVFESEPKSELSSFVASHIHNVMDSQSPSKAYLRHGYLTQIVIPSNVPSVLKTVGANRYTEYSTFNTKHNLGFSYEAAMYFPKGEENPLPDFLQLNLTIDMFGKSYNSLQLGLSRRLVPKISSSISDKMSGVMTYFKPDMEYNERMMAIMPYFFAVDSYYRVHGTTICMGGDIVEHMKGNEFFSYEQDPETGVFRFDFVKAFSVFSHEVKVPTISGLPLAFTSQVAYLPKKSANHTGNAEHTGLLALLTDWDPETGVFAHNKTTDSSFVVAVDVSTGKGTPVQMGHHYVGKIHVNSSIGFESKKDDEGWIKTINFPEMTVASLRVTAVRQFYMDYNGRQFQKLNMFGEMGPTEPTELFGFGGMGLQATGQLLTPQGEYPLDVIFKVEKTEEQFTGYGLSIQLDESFEQINANAWAMGLSTEDAIHFYYNLTGVGYDDLENSDDKIRTDLTIQADMTQRGLQASGLLVTYKSIGHSKAEFDQDSIRLYGLLESPTCGLLRNPKYSFSVDLLTDGDDMPVIDWTIENYPNNASSVLKFSGPLEDYLGEMKGKVKIMGLDEVNENDIQDPTAPGPRDFGVKYEFSLKSESFGENSYTGDLSNVKGEVWLNESVKFQDISFDVSHHLEPLPSREIRNEKGDLVTSIFNGLVYTVTYKDNQGKAGTGVAKYDEHRDYKGTETIHVNNATLHITSTEMKDAFVMEATLQKERAKGSFNQDQLKRKMANIYVDAFGRKQAELTWDSKHSQKTINSRKECRAARAVMTLAENDEEALVCQTTTSALGLVVADHVEFLSTFSNDKGNSLTHDVRAYHIKSQTKFNLTYDLDFPLERNGKGVETKLVTLTELGNRGESWRLEASTDLDMENRTIAHNCELKRLKSKNKPEAKWKTSLNGNWPKNLFNGESNLEIRHESADFKSTAIEISNKATMSGERTEEFEFTNTLTALIDHHGKAKIAKPKKKFTWSYTSDNRLSQEEKEKYDFMMKSKSEVKLERMTEEPEEIFRYLSTFDFLKELNTEIWRIENGHVEAAYKGKEFVGLNYNLGLHIIPEGQFHSHNHKITAVSKYTPPPSSTTRVNFYSGFAGWFEQTLANGKLQNDTFHHSCYYDFYPHEARFMAESSTGMRFVGQDDGKEVFKMEMNAVKDVYYKDWLHFQHFEKVYMDLNNVTWYFIKDIQVNGPRLRFYVVNEGENDKDSWLIDVTGGAYVQKHQNKFNLLSRSGSKEDHNGNSHNHHAHDHHHRGSFIPYTNFNLTISRR